jgi:hypothetical protein
MPVKSTEDMRAAAEFVLGLGHAIAGRIGVTHRRIRYFNNVRFELEAQEGGFTLSHGDGLSRRALHASPFKILHPCKDGSFRVGIAVLVCRFEFTWFPSCIGIVFKLHRSMNGRFIIEEPIGRFSQGRRIDPSLYGRMFNWNEAEFDDFVASFQK